MMVATAWWGIRRGPAARARAARAFDAREARAALWEAKWELLTPGRGARRAVQRPGDNRLKPPRVTAVYVARRGDASSIAICTSSRDLPRVMTECGLLVGGVLLILGVALGFTNYLVDAEVPAHAVEWTTRVDAFAVALSPAAQRVPDHRRLPDGHLLGDHHSGAAARAARHRPTASIRCSSGIIFLANLELGYLTPPVGLESVTCHRIASTSRSRRCCARSLPIIIVLHIGVLLITYVPALTTPVAALARALGRSDVGVVLLLA